MSDSARRWFLGIFAVSLGRAAPADIITGQVSGWPESGPVIPIGDGVHHVSMWWSIHTYGADGWFYGSAYGAHDTDVAVVRDVRNIVDITDASVFQFTSLAAGPASDSLSAPDQAGDLVIWRNVQTGHYGVLQIIEITHDTLEGPWWFQTDGSGDFSEADPCGGFVPCDMNCDGSVNGFDIQPLLDLLSGGTCPCCPWSPCLGDTNLDGSINGSDIEHFIDCLSR